MDSTAENFDLIVVGAGIAGHSTALAAAQAGARVLLLEKTGQYGGSTAMCGGAFAFAGTDLQKANGIDDSPELLEEDLMKAGQYRNDRALVHLYAQRQLDAWRWLEGLGLHFERVSLSGAQSVPRNHSIDPNLVLRTLHEHALATGRVTFRANAPVRRLLLREGGDVVEGRAVVGVELVGGERLLARGGVVLATGGFSRAADLIERFVPHLRDARKMGGEGNTGDGLRMAWALGADLVDMALAKGTFGAPLVPVPREQEENAPRLLSAMYRGAIVVNTAARRFVNESVSYKVIGDRCLEQPDAKAFQIFDQQVMDQSAPLPTVVDFRGGLAAGLVAQADSLDELAMKLGLDAQVLRETVQRYNAACDGLLPDECDRTSLSTGYGKPTRIERGPFYGIATTTGLTSTYSGLRTDTRARVIDVFGDTITGLYAVGEVVGGFHGETYMSGSSLGKGCVFGRIAAADAAARAGVTAAVA
ncbi:MAG: FAD-dependent oxidoreductase [Burkholderiales bacterium]